MRCLRCRKDNPPQAKFCLECGARLALACAACGTELPPGARFCLECGRAVGAPAEEPPPSPRAYTPKHLAEKILTSRSALEGERKQVTVLFCDIVESSRLAERLDPEVMHQIMDRALRLMAEAVHRYEGTVNQFLGDGLMALFGAPVALEDHAFRAVQAALAIQETLSGLSEQLKHERGVEIRLRLGLNTGLVVVGRIGDDLRMDYTAIGDATHLAARMQAMADPGTILISEATHRLVEGYVRSESLGAVQVKGRAEPIVAYRVTGRRRARSRLDVSAERGLTPLAGRQRELALLHECLARATAGRGQAVAIAGEAGVGKSRLLYEFHKSLEGARVTWLAGHCAAYGQATPYLPVLEILRTNFHIEEGDNPLQVEEKLRQGVRQLDAGLEWILPFLGEVFALPGDDPALKHLDAKDRRQKTFAAIRALTAAGAARRPHVLILEDLHWIDKTSEDYLSFFVESLAGLPALLLTTHRPGYTVRWAEKTYYTQMALDLLTEGEVEAMVGRLVGTSEPPPDLLRLIRDKAEGNPLFVEEITSSLQERGALVRRNGGLAWNDRAVIELPATIQDIIRARLDRLEEPVKRTAQTAAVIGREFGLGLLTRISDISGEVQRDLETLKHLELIHEKRFFPEIEYIFKHAVIQDVAYQTLLRERRELLHTTIGRAIEDLYPDRLEEQAAILAYHYARSRRPDRAVEFALLAGDRAAHLHANAEAATYYEQALTTARALPPSPETERAQIDAALKLTAVGVTRQDIERDRTNLEAARSIAERLDDQPRLARVLYWLGRIQYVLADPNAAIELATRSLEVAESVGDDSLAAPAVNLMGRVYWHLSDFAQAAPLLKRSVEQMRRLGNKTEEATAAAFAGQTFGHMGDFEPAYLYGDHGVTLAREIQNPFAEAAACFCRAVTSGLRGEWSRAMDDFEDARQVAERVGDVFRAYMVMFYEGWALVTAGEVHRGRALVEQGLALAGRIGTRFQLSCGKNALAACLLASGDIEAASALSREALELAEQTSERFMKSVAYRLLAEALARLEPHNPEKAERAVLEAIRLQEAMGTKPELARSHVEYARLLVTKDERARARDELSTAITMFREMGMTWDLARAEQELRETA